MTISKVKQLSIVKADPSKPNEKIVTMLREALKQAKEGKIQCIGIAVGIVDPGNHEGDRSTETWLSASDNWHHTLATGVNGLAFRLNYERYSQGSALPSIELKDDDE